MKSGPQPWNPAESPLFTAWTDPVSGITSYLLRERVAPVMQSFYFTNSSLSDDGRWLWFYCAFPPGGSSDSGRTLGVADLAEGKVTHFPETQFRDASPWVDPATGEVYWCAGHGIYKRGPQPEDRTVFVNALPEAIHRHRGGKRLATHLTRSADGKELFVDAHLGREWVAGSMPLDGGDFVVWKRFDRCYNHAQFSPTDPDCALIAQDWWIDIADGERHEYANRMWILGRDGSLRPLMEAADTIGHEWWDPDGEHVWFVDYKQGTGRIHIRTLGSEIVWPAGNVHSHASRCGRLLVGDIGTYSWDRTGCRVAFFDRRSGREFPIVSEMPLPPYPRPSYHLDPHPQFCAHDRFVVYTTTVLGRIDLALVHTADLIAHASSSGWG